MNQIVECFKQAELALAAYGDLAPGVPDIQALKSKDVGMTPTQAADFAAKWTVIGIPYNDTATGVSAVVFQDADGNKTLAIRGTQGATDYLADYLILNGTPSQLNPQYQSLKAKVTEWLTDGTLTSGFTVTGHSLGGYLAAGLVADFDASIGHAYLYNAPGNNSTVSQILQVLGIAATPDAAKITSLRADAGISPIAALGNDFSPPIPIAIENQLDPSLLLSAPAALNHSQQILTDALAVYALFAELSPALTVDQIGSILKADANQNASTLESAVQALTKLYLPGTPDIPREDRDALYTAMYDLQQNTLFQQDAGLVQVQSLASFPRDTLVAQAQTDIAYRYALKELNPFAVLGDDALYAPHNAHGELDLYAPATGTGTLTDLYLQDRAAFLTWANQANTQDKTILRGPNGPENWQFTDQAKNYTLNVMGQVLGSNSQNPYRKVIFDGDTAGWVEGGAEADRLYGGGGDDILKGKRGGYRWRRRQRCFHHQTAGQLNLKTGSTQ